MIAAEPDTPEGRLRAVQALHVKRVGTQAGMTDGYCTECDYLWPCRTWHLTVDPDPDAWHECREEGWCRHAEVPIR